MCLKYEVDFAGTPDAGVKVGVALQQLSVWAYRQRLCVAAAVARTLLLQAEAAGDALQTEPEHAAPRQSPLLVRTSPARSLGLVLLLARAQDWCFIFRNGGCEVSRGERACAAKMVQHG